jgi:hypothetical protein
VAGAFGVINGTGAQGVPDAVAVWADVAERVTHAVTVPQIGYVTAAFDDAGVVALAAVAVVEVGGGVLEGSEALDVLAEAGEEARWTSALTGAVDGVGAVTLFAGTILPVVAADTTGRIVVHQVGVGSDVGLSMKPMEIDLTVSG